MPRPLRNRVDVRVNLLKVPIAWRVGRVTFRPPGWLQRQLTHAIRHPLADPELVSTGKRLVGDWKWSSADLTVLVRPGETVPSDEVRETVRDAIAVARMYQRSCVPLDAMDRQTFGLVTDIDATLDWQWYTDRRGPWGFGGAWHGVVAPWEFTKTWIRDFRNRPAFAYLDDALRRSDDKRTDWQRRAIVAVRTLNYASPMLSQPMRIVQQAVALEALLGDAALPPDRDKGGQAHRVAQRAAYLTCEIDGARLAAGRVACLDLTAKSATQLAKDPQEAQRPLDLWDWPCTNYWHVRQLFDARNAALHDAKDHFPERTAMRYEWRLDHVILASLDWVANSKAAGLADLDRAIGSLPR
jgi:hypothetical protein